MSVNIHEAKTHFSKLVARVQQGEEVTIAKGGRPVARLVPAGLSQARRKPGSAKGQIKVTPSFDTPLPKRLLNRFE